MKSTIHALGQIAIIIGAAVGVVLLFLILAAIGIAIPTFFGWFMGLAAGWMFGPWLENGVQELLGVTMSLDVLGAVLGFIFGVARLGISAAQSSLTVERKDRL